MGELVEVFKLVTGEEIIARVVSRGDATITIRKPRVLQMVPQGPGQVGIAMLPWMIADLDGTFELGEGFVIITRSELDPALENSYLQQTSGIELPSARSVSGVIS